MKVKAKILTLVLSVFSISIASANVSLRNGNFFIGYTDLIYPGGFEPKVERVYNSKTPYKGIFGWGWGTEYEVYLTVGVDGSVILNEYGGGAQNRFYPKNFSEKALQQGVNRLVKVAQKAGAIGSGSQLKNYQQKLMKDSVFRNTEWQKYLAQGKIKPVDIKTGTRFYSNRFSFQSIVKAKKGFRRIYENGKSEAYSDDGKLIQVTDKNNNFLKFNYYKNGNLASAVDNFNRKIVFKFNRQGLVSEIIGESKKKASYQYNKSDQLVLSRDVDGNTYRYSYDKRHNMKQIAYSDKTTLEVDYYPQSKNENVKSVKDRDGSVTDYSYQLKKKDRSHFVVSLQAKNPQGKVFSKSSYEYMLKTKKTGEEWTYRMIANVDGLTTDTTYHPEFGLPVRIKRGSDLSTFKYDNRGHVIQKNTPSELVRLRYDPSVGKVAKVMRQSKRGKKERNWSEFKYDKSGNLVFAKNSEKQGVKLFYDRNGRISSMVDQNKRAIYFKYNENSKPVEIKDPKLGAIRVKYKNSGEVASVESSAGRKIALKVTSAFQNLLDIIRPAGVTLSF